MEIKELRKKTKLSQSEFSNKFGIPVRTLQKWEQGSSEPLTYLISLIQKDITREEFIDVSKYFIKNKRSFKNTLSKSFKNVTKIHPIQQRRIENILNVLKEYESVKKVIVFGSSVTDKCNYDSDIDIYVELKKEENVKTYNVDCPVDFWTNFNVPLEMMDEIKRNGVVIYER